MPERYRQEIEDILARNASSTEEKGAAKVQRPWSGISRLVASRVLSPWKILVASITLLLVALLVRTAAPAVMSVLFWLGLFVFIVAYAMFFIRWGNRSGRRWRGKPVDDGRFSLFTRFRSRFGRQRPRSR